MGPMKEKMNSLQLWHKMLASSRRGPRDGA